MTSIEIGEHLDLEAKGVFSSWSRRLVTPDSIAMWRYFDEFKPSRGELMLVPAGAGVKWYQVDDEAVGGRHSSHSSIRLK